MTSPVLQVNGLWKRFSRADRPAVEELTLEANGGEVLGLVGLNGAGKTTTIRVAAGLALPTRGTVRVGGFDVVKEKTEAGRQVGWVAETPLFEPGARALPLLRYHAGFHGLTGSAGKRRCTELLEEVGLAGQERKRFRAYSQGMRKRFALACAMLGDPPCLLLDEILNGLDPEGVRLVRRLMVEFKRQGRAVLLSSHILAEVEQVSDRVAVIHRGRLIKTLTRSDLEQKAGAQVRVTIANPDAGSLEYLRSVGTLREEGGTVWISGAKASPEELSAELVRRGYRISALGTEKRSLEALFFDTIDQAEGRAPPAAREKTP